LSLKNNNKLFPEKNLLLFYQISVNPAKKKKVFIKGNTVNLILMSRLHKQHINKNKIASPLQSQC
jgi:hypothetical protein